MVFAFLPWKNFFGLGSRCQQQTCISLTSKVLTEGNKTVLILKHLQEQAFGTKLSDN